MAKLATFLRSRQKRVGAWPLWISSRVTQIFNVFKFNFAKSSRKEIFFCWGHTNTLGTFLRRSPPCQLPIVHAVGALNVAKLSRLRSWWLACRDIVPPSRQPSKHYLSLWDDSVRTSLDLAFWQCGKLIEFLFSRQTTFLVFIYILTNYESVVLFDTLSVWQRQKRQLRQRVCVP